MNNLNEQITEYLARVFDSSITKKVSTGRIKPVFFCQIFCCNI